VHRTSDSLEPGADTTSTTGVTRKQMIIIFFARTTLATAHRIVYPFLPSLARGLGISIGAATGLVTLRMVAGVAAPLLGPYADRLGRRRTMELALLAFALAGTLLVGIDALAAAAAAFLLYGLSRALYNPSVQALLGDLVPYGKRGRVVGRAELSWATAWLLGVPIAGLLIERFGWWMPWAVLTVLGLAALYLTRRGLPRDRDVSNLQLRRTLVPSSLVASWRTLFRQPGVLALLISGLLIAMAIEIPFIVYGAWIEEGFGLGLGTLGIASISVGLAEAAAEVGTSVLTDRLGKKRSVVLGLLGMALSLTVLPVLGRHGVVSAMSGVVLVTLCFEFAIVSLLPLTSQIVPDARATLLSFGIAAGSVGRILGATLGGWMWERHANGIALHAFSGAFCALLAALVMARGLAEPGAQ
jgi:predicted MFS family arabinose efflux permease